MAMTIHLPDDLRQFIRAEIDASRYATESEILVDAISRLKLSRERGFDTGDTPPVNDRGPIWEVAREISRSIAPADIEKLPVDGAMQHDHYVHGLLKRGER